MKRIYLSLLPCLASLLASAPRAPKRGFPCLRLSVSGKRTGSNPIPTLTAASEEKYSSTNKLSIWRTSYAGLRYETDLF